jgi:hypothetical protein
MALHASRQAKTARGMETTTHDLTTKLSSLEIPHDTDLSRRRLTSLTRSKSNVFQAERPIFEYLPLHTSARTIRLTRITCNEHGELRGQLRHFRFGQEPTYQALSYTWGVDSAMKTILMDGKRDMRFDRICSASCNFMQPGIQINGSGLIK